jgi:hypothetical protein
LGDCDRVRATRVLCRSSGGREGVCDSPIVGELVVAEEEDVPEGIEGSRGDDGVTDDDDDEEGGEEIEELEEDDVEEKARGTTADWRRGDDESSKTPTKPRAGVEGRSPNVDALSAIRRCLWGRSVIEEVNHARDGSLTQLCARPAHVRKRNSVVTRHQQQQHDEVQKDATSVPEASHQRGPGGGWIVAAGRDHQRARSPRSPTTDGDLHLQGTATRTREQRRPHTHTHTHTHEVNLCERMLYVLAALGLVAGVSVLQRVELL